jgi:hypothetical protein
MCGGKIVHGHALKLIDGWWWIAEDVAYKHTRESGPLGDEHIHYVRGHLRTWWPPHRKRIDALLVAAALGSEPTAPASEPVMTEKTAKRLMGAMMRGLNTDAAKLSADYEKIRGDAYRHAVTREIQRLTRRWP